MSGLRLRFDDFVLDPARRELARAGERLELPPKVFDCIAYLATHRERAVGRDELVAAVWGRVEVTDNLVDQIMLRARRAVGDTGSERRIIRTVPRFGYAWVAPTEIVGEETAPREPAPATDAAEMQPAVEPAPRRRVAARPLWLAAVAALLAIVALAAWRFWPARDDRATPSPRADASLALLLPVAVDGDANFAWARLGAMDLIAERLRAAGQPMVPSDNVVALARPLAKDEPAPAELRPLVDATAAKLVLGARAEYRAGYWRVGLRTLYGRDPPILAEGESQELMDAARVAADRLARQLGFAPPANEDLVPPRERALAGLLQQVEAAMLADRPDTARALLATLDAEQSARPDVRYRSATIAFRSGDLDAAEKEFQALLDSASSGDDPLFRARVLNGLGNVALRRDDYAKSEREADAVVALLGDSSPSPELGRALTGRAIALSAQYRFEPALADFAKARVVLESVGDRLGLARVDANLGILDARRDRYAEALPVLTSSAERLAAFHDLTSELFARVAAAYASLALVDPAAALAGEPRLRELVEREPNAQWKRYARIALADVLHANGRLDEAKSLLRNVLDDAARENDAPMLASARIVEARYALDDGEAARAASIAADVLKTSWEAETPREQAGAWMTLVRAYAELGRVDDARAAADEARAWAQKNASPAANLYADLAAAESAAAAHDSTTASAAFERALAAAESGRVPDDLLRVCIAYADYLLDARDLARAGAVAARVAGWSDRSYDAALLQAKLYRALGQSDPLRASLTRARALAGERALPRELASVP